ncbi:MAG: hypothetical protein RI885_2382 [Actinomycetota bacterium]
MLVLGLLVLSPLSAGASAVPTGDHPLPQDRGGASAAQAAAAGVDDFTFDSFSATYALSRDVEGRSVLRVEETLVAEFPPEQNRGIRRELVERYDGHPTDLEVVSVTDEDGSPRDYDSESDDDFTVLEIAEDDFVEGRQTYVITYEQHNVTQFFDDTGADEFYWDVNGTGWAQPFRSVTASVVLDDALQEALTGDTDAVSGAEGAAGPASIRRTDEGFIASADDLAPGENLTLAIGFEPGTFEPRDDGFAAAPWPSLSLVSALLAIGAAVAAVVLRRRRLRDAPGRGVIVAEYLPPTTANLLTCAVILSKQGRATTAQILQLAVAGNLRIVEEPGRKKKYGLQLVTADGADGVGLEFLHAVFGDTLTPGEGRDLEKADTRAAKRLAALIARVSAAATADGLRRPLPIALIAGVLLCAVVFTLATLLLAVASFADAVGGAVPAVFIVAAAASMTVVIVAVSKQPLEPRGVELRDHLLGLREYITLAERDRLRFLQSPEGAERTAQSPTGSESGEPASILRINERLLPFAVLFGVEKRWADEIGRKYEQNGSTPYWFEGSSAFSATVLTTGIGSVSASASSSFSSSSGGSGGGASSGGGGGGGGGGGV